MLSPFGELERLDRAVDVRLCNVSRTVLISRWGISSRDRGSSLPNDHLRSSRNAHNLIDLSNGLANCPSHNLTKVGSLRYLLFSTAAIITSNDNTAPYLFNPIDCSQIWAPSRKPFSYSHADAGTAASLSGTLCFR